jgi:hypothetical protein
MLRLIDVTFAMSQWHVSQAAGASMSECPLSGAASCTYQRWFRHGPTQGHVLGGSLHGHARLSSRAHQLLRLRLGCHGLPCVLGWRTGIPRHMYDVSTAADDVDTLWPWQGDRGKIGH